MTTHSATAEQSQRQISLPLSKAMEIAFRSLKIRFWRSLITIGGIFFGIAFLMSILTSSALNKALLDGGSSQVRALLEQKGTDAETETKQIWLVTLSLLVCVVGITNAMLMSVTERYREIGTMKCLGALDIFIIELFLLESAFQGLVGSLGMEPLSVFPVMCVLKFVLYSLGAGLFLSIVGALYPAQQAAKMLPADAMRTEV